MHYKPRLHRLLRAAHLDVAYDSGAGAHLYRRRPDGQLIADLDLVGGYGSLLLGHHHPELVAEAQHLLASGRPQHTQFARAAAAERLAALLAQRVGFDCCCILTNSGAEAVEAAMKHALLATGRHSFLALRGAFHGKTLAALQLADNRTFRGPFVLAGLAVNRIDPDSLEDLEAAFASDLPAGFLFEPIRGEGGVRPVPATFLRRAAELCRRHRVPFIADEAQTGCGRTGRFLACESLDLQPDYVILSKALGGGLAKIAALLIHRECYCEAFDLLHTSTYAADDFSCALACKVLELLDAPMLEQIRTIGDRLLGRLRALQEAFPDVITDVRGAGLMLGVEFRASERVPGVLLRCFAELGDLGYLLTGFLLHMHRVRVTGTLSDPLTLRLQPPACLTISDEDQLVAALADVCARIRAGDTPGLTHFLAVDHPDEPELLHEHGVYWREHVPPASPPGVGRVAWLFHLIDADDMPAQEPAFAAESTEDRERALECLITFAVPMVQGVRTLRSAAGRPIEVVPILLPITSRTLKRWFDAGETEPAGTLLRSAAAAAVEMGCSVIALGQYTSIVSRNGLSLRRGLPQSVCLTTGNSFTVCLAIRAIEEELERSGRREADCELLVAGAAGNIGRVCAEILAQRYRRTTLLGSNRPGSADRLRDLAALLPRAEATTDRAAVGRADVAIVAVNSVDVPFSADEFAPRAVVCDVSVPGGVRGTTDGRTLLRGGVALLPGGEDLRIVGFPLPVGQTFGCMAEALLLGLEGVAGRDFIGSVKIEQVRYLSELATRHGFALAGPHTFSLSGVSEQGRDESR